MRLIEIINFEELEKIFKPVAQKKYFDISMNVKK